MINYVAVNVSIISESPGIFIDASNNKSTLHIYYELNLTLTCSISFTPAANSVFKWRCSTGCLVGIKMKQTINATIQKSGVIFCTYTLDGIEYSSDPLVIKKIGKLYKLHRI